MLRAPSLPRKKIAELSRLARAIPGCPGNPSKQKQLLEDFNRLSGLDLAAWQFDGAVFWSREADVFVECALSHLEEPEAPSAADAKKWIEALRDRSASMADTHHSLRSLERLSKHPEDVARLVFFTDLAPKKVLAALLHDERAVGLGLLGADEAKIDGGDIDEKELAALVELADEGIDCADKGDREGLARAARALTKRTGQVITEQELKALPGAMSTEPWVRGLLLGRSLLKRKRLSWSEARSAAASYFAAIDALDDPRTMALDSLLDAATPYPHVRIHHEMHEDSEQRVEATLREVTRHVAPWGDPPASTNVTVDDVWRAAREWCAARDAKQWTAAVASKTALQEALDQVDLPELRELLSLRDAERRTRMLSLGLSSEPPATKTAVTPAPVVVAAPGPGAERVRHAKFGDGSVVARVGRGEDAIVEVRFADGVRKLQARFLTPWT